MVYSESQTDAGAQSAEINKTEPQGTQGANSDGCVSAFQG